MKLDKMSKEPVLFVWRSELPFSNRAGLDRTLFSPISKVESVREEGVSNAIQQSHIHL